MSLVMIDIDNFKILNDRFGHPAGDQVPNRNSFYLVTKIARYGLSLWRR